MAKGKKKKTSSRAKYELNHPTVSLRVHKELRDRLQAAKQTKGLSYTDILKIGLGLVEVKIRDEKEIWQEAYDEGWEKGGEQAADLYGVTYPCSICGKEIPVTTEDEKNAIRRYMREHGWGHADCINRGY